MTPISWQGFLESGACISSREGISTGFTEFVETRRFVVAKKTTEQCSTAALNNRTLERGLYRGCFRI